MTKNYKTTTIRIEEKELLEIKKICLENNISLSEFIRNCINKAVEKGSLELK